jgi:hypothetical protein
MEESTDKTVLAKMDEAAAEFRKELMQLVAQQPEGINAVAQLFDKYVPTAGLKRIGRILRSIAKA